MRIFFDKLFTILTRRQNLVLCPPAASRLSCSCRAAQCKILTAFQYIGFLIVIFGMLPLAAQGLRYEPPKIPGYESPFESSYSSPLSENSPRILKVESKLFTDTTVIDFEKRQLTFVRQDDMGNTVWTYHYGELSDFIADGRSYSFYNSWYNKLTDEARRDLGVSRNPRLQWELAVHYPPWAQRLLGNDPPRLKIEGRLEVTLSSEYNRFIRGTDTTSNFNSFEFDTNYEFSITGSVGRLISVSISHSKSDGFNMSDDPLKNFKVEYKESYPGELEDEIIQEIVAGYTGFDMPGTSLSGYSDRADGLFGIKVRAKVGPLMLTTIASHAQGEAFTRELGGRDDPYSSDALKDNMFIKNRYFFLGNIYKEYYNKVNNITAPERNAPKPPRVTNLQVFVSTDPQWEQSTTNKFFNTKSDGYFRQLVENKDYTFDSDGGWVRITHSVSDRDAIAITMVTADPALNKGTVVPANLPNQEMVDVWILKPRNMDEMADPERTDSLFGLMWRNVYDYWGTEDAKLELFFFDPAVGDTVKHTGGQELISRVLGLTDAQGRARLEVVDIFNTENNELIMPPWGPGMNGNEPFANPALGSLADSTIYLYGSRNSADQSKNYVSKFGILTSGTARKTVYDNLGWNILPGTVIVKTKSGTLLREDEDYYLDYQMGILELISPRARAAESILITYQRESDFVLERKVFAGVRGEIKLPFISDNSFAALSLLYQSASTSSGDVPQLGNEPYSKMHLAFNTSLDFEPEWMTQAVNYVPLVKTEEESAAKIDFEIVQSRMSTNTSKGSNAFLDDFQRTKDGYSLSLSHQSWHPSHYPFKYNYGGNFNYHLDSLSASMLKRPPAWDFYWFTPIVYDERHRINRFSIWQRDNNSRFSGSDNYLPVLRLHATPASKEHPLDVSGRFKDAYASITTSFGRNGLNMENHRYLELLVKPEGTETGIGKKGKLMIQIGTFRHDQVRDGGPPSGRLAVEDTTYQNKPDQLARYDIGLNGRAVEDKFYLIPNPAEGVWDTVSRDSDYRHLIAFPRSYDDPSGDLFRKYNRDSTGNFRFVNGTRGNNIFDTENIDGDGIPRVNIRESYYSYEIDLDKHAAYLDTNARLVKNSGWKLYRIPLKEIFDPNDMTITKDTLNNPDWSRMRGMRLVWHDFDSPTQEHKLLIAGMEFVGNYWESVPLANGDAPKIIPLSISNYEDSAYYASVHNRFVKPKAGEETPEEMSLRLVFSDLLPGDTALVRKNMSYYPQNISGYEYLSVQVHGDVDYGNDVDFVFRFGSDDSTFYEYRGPIRRGWNNHIYIKLQDLSDLKLAADRDNQPIDAVSADGRLRIRSPQNKRPNFNTVTFMALGVMRGQGGGGGGIDGEIWVNELMVTGARSLTGVAARVNVSTQWADFLSLGAGMNYSDGYFRRMSETFGLEDRSEISANVNTRVQMDKFMPDDWGVSLPLGGSVSGSLSRPTIRPQSDILLLKEDGNPDGFTDMANGLFNRMLDKVEEGEFDTPAQRFETFSTTQTVYSSFEKTTISDNPLIAFTFDRIKTDASYNKTSSFTGRGPHEDPGAPDYYRTDTTVTYTGNLRYDLSPRNPPEWTSATPFSNAEWVPKLYKNYTFNLLPSTINFDVAEFQHRTEKRNDAKLNVHDFTTYTFDLRHGTRIEYSPINPLLTFGYGLRLDRDLSDHELKSDWDYIVDSTFTRVFGLHNRYAHKWNEYGIVYGERGRTQSASMRLAPQFVGWLTHSVDYTADYSGNIVQMDNDSTQYLNANVRTGLRFRNSLLVGDFFKELSAIPVGGDFFGMIHGGTGKIGMRSINMDYDVSTDLRNSYLSSTFLADTAGMSNYDFFKYQLGMRREFGDYIWGRQSSYGLGYMFYREDEGVEHGFYRHDQSSGSWSVRYSTAFHIPDPFRINFTNVSVGWGREFWAQPDTAFIDTTIVFPEVRVSANTDLLMKLSFVNTHMTRLSLNSSFGYKKSRKELRDRIDTTTNVDYQPLIGLEGRFVRWPTLSANYRHGISTAKTAGVNREDGEVLSREETNRYSHTLTLAYEISNTSGLREIKLLGWIIPVQGRTNVGLTINHDKNVRVTWNSGDAEDKVDTGTELSYSPFVDYRFTDNIRGHFRYIGTHRNQDGAKTMQQRLALTVEVVF